MIRPRFMMELKSASRRKLLTFQKTRKLHHGPELCIYKVPTTLRQINEIAYSPQVISIGPIHHGDKNLAAMERQKPIYLKEFCKRVKKWTGRTQDEVLTDLRRSIGESEGAIRRCYEDIGSFDSKKFVEMIMLDSVFIIEFFWRIGFEDERYKNDLVTGGTWPRSAIKRDLILLENQLPFFVLREVYNEALPPSDYALFAMRINDYFENSGKSIKFLRYPSSWRQIELTYDQKVTHIVDLLRSFHVEESKLQSRSHPVKLKYSATKLQQAGVKFEVVNNGSLDDIHFDSRKGVLKLPCFEVYDTSESLIRSLMALEQRHYRLKTYICNYFFLMDHLINTTEDVDLLVGNGVIISWLGNHTMVADLVNRLCQGIEESESCYGGICEDLNDYCNNPINRSKAALKLEYFSNHWKGAATLGAITVVVLTFIQTVCSILQLV